MSRHQTARIKKFGSFRKPTVIERMMENPPIPGAGINKVGVNIARILTRRPIKQTTRLLSQRKGYFERYGNPETVSEPRNITFTPKIKKDIKYFMSVAKNAKSQQEKETAIANIVINQLRATPSVHKKLKAVKNLGQFLDE